MLSTTEIISTLSLLLSFNPIKSATPNRTDSVYLQLVVVIVLIVATEVVVVLVVVVVVESDTELSKVFILVQLMISLFIETSGLDTQHTTDSTLDDFIKDTGELQQIRLDGGGSLRFFSEYSSDIVFIGDDKDNTVDGNVLDNDDDDEEEEEDSSEWVPINEFILIGFVLDISRFEGVTEEERANDTTLEQGIEQFESFCKLIGFTFEEIELSVSDDNDWLTDRLASLDDNLDWFELKWFLLPVILVVVVVVLVVLVLILYLSDWFDSRNSLWLFDRLAESIRLCVFNWEQSDDDDVVILIVETLTHDDVVDNLKADESWDQLG